MSGKSQTIGDFTVSRLSQILPTKNSKSHISFRMDGDKSGESRAFLFSRHVPDFCDGRRSFPTNENWNLYRRRSRRWISLITNPLNRWDPVSLSYIGVQHTNFNFWRTFHSLPPNSISGVSGTDFWRFRSDQYQQIWDGRQKVKSLIVWDFPGIWTDQASAGWIYIIRQIGVDDWNQIFSNTITS